MQTYAFRDGDHLVITFQFWREAPLLDHPEHAGQIFEVQIAPAEFTGILENLEAALQVVGARG
ncbi:hypothetical protein NN3_40750 [Nocardia neocaledoniensis NBRC 108232]|uniref:hypothetical protein n=1 Tax=Nocardia neocaledoniensis TaxID=236511 RepID=UPI000D715CB0|nr:hypothetical protein [Nocardia neocaledoniensis]GEM33068.1 hypothetical protein NN3_40750 [Nocardia neocaledoniensis NBRC 108232]